MQEVRPDPGAEKEITGIVIAVAERKRGGLVETAGPGSSSSQEANTEGCGEEGGGQEDRGQEERSKKPEEGRKVGSRKLWDKKFILTAFD